MLSSEGRVEQVRYRFEYDDRVRCGFVGAGGHAFRNVYPALQYAPVDLVAVCDLDEARATEYARLFGGARAYTDLHAMLAAEQLDAVLVVTAYTPDGRLQATDIALELLEAGVHVWTEKPSAASVAEVVALRDASAAAGRFVMTGLKKMFTPGVEKVKDIISTPEFGPVGSLSVRYPESLPAADRRHDLNAMRGFLDHIYHPAAVITHLMGPIERLSYERDPVAGASVTIMRFTSGAVGSLHLAGGAATTSPLERVEVTGRDANVVLDDGVTLTYYRPGGQLPYGRSGSYVVPDDVAPLRWAPEHSLGQLYNKNLFFLGYVPEILHFCRSVLTGTPPEKGTLDDVLAVMRMFEAYRFHPEGTTIVLTEREDEAP